VHLNIGVGRCSVLGADRDVARIFFSIEAKKISARSRSPREARRAESGGGVLEEVQPVPPHQLGSPGSAVSSPSVVRDGSPAAKRFSRVLNVQSGLSRQFSVVYRSL